MRFAAITLCLLATIDGADAAMRFGREIAFSAPESGVAPGQRQSAAVATNGDAYFVLWGDAQGSPLTDARFTHDGVLLDPYGIDVAPSQQGAGVIWTGRHYLIAWISFSHLCVRALTTEGQMGPIKNVGRAAWTARLGMATNGSSVAITPSGSDTWLVDGDGNLLREVYTWGGLLNPATVVSAGSGYVVAYTHPYGEGQYLKVVAVSAEGVATVPREIRRSFQLTTATMGTDGESPLLVWGEAISIRAVQLSAQGVPKSDPQEILQLPFGQWPRQFDLTWRGGDYALTYAQWPWLDFSAKRFDSLQRLARDGTALGAPVQLSREGISGRSFQMAVRPDGSAALVWIDGRYEVLVSFVNHWPMSNGPIAPEASLARAAHGQRGSKLAVTSRGVLAAWTEEEATREEIRLAYPGDAPIVASPSADFARVLDLFVRNDVIWLVWLENRRATTMPIFGRRYSPSLRPIDREPIHLGDVGSGSLPQAASGNGSILISWFEEDQLRALVIGEEEAGVAAAEILVSETEGQQHTVVWDGSAFVVAWFHPMPETSDHTHELLATRIGPTGTVLDPAPVFLAALDHPNSLLSATGPSGTLLLFSHRTGSDSEKSSAVLYRGSAKPPLHRIPGFENLFFGALVALPDGFWLLRTDYWGRENLILDAFAPDLSLISRTTIAPSGDGTHWPEQVIAFQGQPVIAYQRTPRNMLLGRTWRGFIRMEFVPRDGRDSYPDQRSR